MLIKSNIRLNQLMKTLPNGKAVLDFKKIEDKGFMLHILITERGAKGKTFNIKDRIREDFQENGSQAIWLMNTIGLLEKQQADFVKDFNKPSVGKIYPKEHIDWWNSLKFRGKMDSNTGGFYAGDEQVIKFLSLGHSELMKGARVGYKRVVYEEFNVKSNVVPKPVEKFDSLLHSLEDLVANHQQEQELKVYIFGNNKTLNNPIINRMGIRTIEHEIMELRDENGEKIALIIAPQFNEEEMQQIEEDNKKNKIYQLSKLMGTHTHSYFNASLFDELNRVVQYTNNKESASQLIPLYTLVHKGEWLNLYKINGGFHIVNIDKMKDKDKLLRKVIFNKRDAEENCAYNTILKRNMFIALSMDKLTFEDITSRDYFISALQ